MTTPAEYVIGKFGGQTALAGVIGKGASTVQHWAKVGRIPAKWHGVILDAARQAGINLDPSDFVEVPGIVEVLIEPKVPEARWSGEMNLADGVPCYVLDDGRRVISRTGAVGVLTGKKGDGNLENYIGVKGLVNYMPPGVHDEMVEFSLPGVVNRNVRGVTADTFLRICRAFVQANAEQALTTPRQEEIAFKASIFLGAVADVGLLALIDEATGYQYERAQDALQIKLQVFLEAEMRDWEKTFPDELWREFGRLTGWKGSINSRPKYWGKLVMELVYDYLDKDVSQWLKENTPKPRHGQNYHQWLSSQYGLKKLVEHIWMLIGMATACESIHELRRRMAERFGRQPVQATMFVDASHFQITAPR